MEKHLTVLGILHIAFGGMFVLVGIAGLLFFGGIGAASGEGDAFAILAVIGTVGFMFMAALGLPGIVGGIGLMNHRPWARYLIMALSCLNVFAVPIGTALAIYAFWVLLNDEAIKLFEPQPPAPTNGS
jgi:hypothetical protein